MTHSSGLAEQLQQADALLDSGKLAEAETLYRNWLNMHADPSTRELQAQSAHALTGLARCLAGLKRLPEAEQALENCLSIVREVRGPESKHAAAALQNLARVKGNHSPVHAASLNLEALLILEKLHGPDSAEVAQALVNLSSHQYAANALEEARETLDRAMHIWTELKGPESDKMATCYNNLARIFEKEGDYESGIALHGKAYEIRKKLYGDDHMDTATSKHNLAIAYFDIGNYFEAMAAFCHALRSFVNAGLEDTPEARACQDNLRRCEQTVQQQGLMEAAQEPQE